MSTSMMLWIIYDFCNRRAQDTSSYPYFIDVIIHKYPIALFFLVITLLSFSNWNTLLYAKATNWKWKNFRINYLLESIRIRYFYSILEIFWQYIISCFTFYLMSLPVNYAMICLFSAFDLRKYIYLRSIYRILYLN